MKNLKPIIGIAALVLIACAPSAPATQPPQKTSIGNGISYTRDYEHGVVCYKTGEEWLNYPVALSCVVLPRDDNTVQFK